MASISTNKKNERRIFFCGLDGKEHSIWLGKVPARSAETFRVLIDSLEHALMTGQAPERDVLVKIERLLPRVRAKLEHYGLMKAKVTQAETSIGQFITDYVKTRTKVKPATKEIWRQGEKSLLAFFGSDRPLQRVTPGDADEYLEHLQGTKLAPMTVRKRLQFAKMVFRAATRKHLIPSDPFADVSFQASKPDKSFFVTRAMMSLLLAACPDHHWRMIVLLSRIGGLRCPSEVLSLKWENINWAEGKILVPSPKTEHHPGKESRVIPLFPELLEQLRECFEAAPAGAVYVIGGQYRQAAMGPFGWRNCNLNVRLRRIVKNAGLTAWPRIFHNLRSSRQTELAEVFPSHVVCAWLGNSEDVAKKHYYQVTDAHFAAANGTSSESASAPNAPRPPAPPAGPQKTDGDSDGRLTGKVTVQVAAPTSTEQHESSQRVAPAGTYAAPCNVVPEPATCQNGWGGI